MNGVLERQWSVVEAAQLLGVSERHTWRLLAAYKKEGAAALAHGNRARLPASTTPVAMRTQVIALARERYQGVNHTHFTELLAEREENIYPDLRLGAFSQVLDYPAPGSADRRVIVIGVRACPKREC